MNITDSIVAQMRGLEAVIVTVAKCLQRGVVVVHRFFYFFSRPYAGDLQVLRQEGHYLPKHCQLSY